MVTEASQQDLEIAPKNFLLIKLDETLLNDLIFSLGIITSELSSIDGIPRNVKDKLENINNDVMLRMDRIVELDSSFMAEGEMVIE